MDQDKFDAIAKSLGTGASRRRVVRGAGAAALAALGLGARAAGAAPGCRSDADCDCGSPCFTSFCNRSGNSGGGGGGNTCSPCAPVCTGDRPVCQETSRGIRCRRA